jgi:hypothetical protein
MLEELKFPRQIQSTGTTQLEMLTVSEESGRVQICIDSEGPGRKMTYSLSWKEEAELLSYLMERLFVAAPHPHPGSLGQAASARVKPIGAVRTARY